MLIGEVDSGYYDAHSQLSASRYSGLTVGGIAGAYNPAHNDSHGTHVAGTLALSFLDGFTFGIGTYDLIGFGSRFGQFSDYAFHGLDGGFTANVLDTADGVEPSIAAIPEPETYALMLGGLALMGGWLGAASASDRPREPKGAPETALLFSWHRGRPIRTHDRMEATDFIEVYDDVLDAASCRALVALRGERPGEARSDRQRRRHEPERQLGHPPRRAPRVGRREAATQRSRAGRPAPLSAHPYSRLDGGESLQRTVLWTIYLNDGFDGGETEFLHQRRTVRPKTGSLLIAPAAFTHTHRGNTPHGGDKFIATSWILFQRAEVMFAEPAR